MTSETSAAPATRLTTLPNGLTVLTREMHGAPVATFWVWYRVGARNEVPGITGISHWAEHMMFKGTPTLAAGDIFRLVNKNGGTLNGFTSLDYTTYYETLPADRLDLAIRIESDRMVNARFDPDEVASERTVIISEKQGGENYPTTHLREATLAAAFRIHPYRQGVIGYLSDLQAITRDDLYGHYRTYYAPNNAVAVAVGDFDTADVLAKIEAAFGALPAGGAVPPVRPVEPAQEGERRVIVRRPGPLPHFLAAFHVPAVDSPDVFPLMVLDTILSGAGSMGVFGGGANLGRSSRLYRALVETELAQAASSSYTLTRDPYLFSVSVALRPRVALEDVERVVFEQLDRLRDEPVPDEELARALKGIRAQFAYASEGVTNVAYWLGSLETIHNHTLYDRFMECLAAVTAADVQRVARQYLTPENRTVGHFVPSDERRAARPERSEGTSGAGAGMERAALWTPGERCWYMNPVRMADDGWRNDGGQDDAFGVPSAAGLALAPSGGPPVAPSPNLQSAIRNPQSASSLVARRSSLPNGIVMLGSERPESPSVVLRARLRAGALYDTEATEGLARLTAAMLQRGTARYSFSELNELTDALGASISADAGRLTVDLTLRCLVEDFDRMAGFLAEVLRRPTFPAEELEKVRGQTIAAILQGDQDTRTVAERGLRKLAYPEGHPYRRSVIGAHESVPAIDRAALADFHRRHYRPDVLTLSVVGGVRFDDAVAAVEREFGDWRAEGEAPPFEIPPAAPPEETRREEWTLAGKTQSDIALGLPALSRTDPDYYALDMANLILGRLGLYGRLGKSVREEQGLAYYAYSALDGGLGPGAWGARAGVNPVNVERAIASTLAEVRRLRDEPVGEEDLADAQDYLTGSLPIALESPDGVA
ncbi:MAG: insulinase family protein, partial [Chloroflexota bacterium]|nr:insulinase family protein [Chloroflexota bacterium]